MLLKVGQVFQAAETVTAIINSNRPLPGNGAYRLSRLYGKLKVEYDLIAAERRKIIEAYDHKVPTIDGKVVEETEANLNHANVVMVPGVPPSKSEEFTAWWKDYSSEEIEVAVEPIPLTQLGDVITAGEYVVLGDLVNGEG